MILLSLSQVTHKVSNRVWDRKFVGRQYSFPTMLTRRCVDIDIWLDRVSSAAADTRPLSLNQMRPRGQGLPWPRIRKPIP